jgi:hypothetical protein
MDRRAVARGKIANHPLTPPKKKAAQRSGLLQRNKKGRCEAAPIKRKGAAKAAPFIKIALYIYYKESR